MLNALIAAKAPPTVFLIRTLFVTISLMPTVRDKDNPQKRYLHFLVTDYLCLLIACRVGHTQ